MSFIKKFLKQQNTSKQSNKKHNGQIMSQNQQTFQDQYFKVNRVNRSDVVLGKYIRSNQYFSVFQSKYPTDKLNQTQIKYMTIKLVGLADPYLSLTQIYNLLNPFDEMFNKIIDHQKSKNQKQKMSQIRLDQSQLHQNQQLQVINISNQVKRQSQVNQNHQNSQHGESLSVSLMFLYFFQKCFNSFFQQNIKKYQLIQILQNFRQSFGPGTSFMKVSKLTQKIYQILEIKQNYSYDQGLIIENFLLHKIYVTYGIQSPLKKEYSIQNLEKQKFSKLYQFQLNLTKRPQLIRKQMFQNKIRSVFDIYGVIIQSKLQYTKMVVQFFISNLKNYRFLTMQKKKQRIQALDMLNRQSTEQSRLKYFLHKNWHKHSPLLVTSQYGLFNPSISQKQGVYLCQLDKDKVLFKSKQIFQNLTQIVVDYYKFFDHFQESQLKDKKYLLPLNVKSLIFNYITKLQSLQLDKLQVLKMLLDLQSNPVTTEIYLVFIKRFLPSLRSEIFLVFRQIIKDEIKNRNQEKHSGITSKDNEETRQRILPVFFLPFINFLVIMYEIQGKTNNFQEQLKIFCQKQTLRENIQCLLDKIYISIKSATTNNHINQSSQLNKQKQSRFTLYINELSSILTDQKFKLFTEYGINSFEQQIKINLNH